MFTKEEQRTAWVAAILIFGTALIYWPAARFDFINLDDTNERRRKLRCFTDGPMWRRRILSGKNSIRRTGHFTTINKPPSVLRFPCGGGVVFLP
jgi:hypothetical protein